jgi:hypothetical protein
MLEHKTISLQSDCRQSGFDSLGIYVPTAVAIIGISPKQFCVFYHDMQRFGKSIFSLLSNFSLAFGCNRAVFPGTSFIGCHWRRAFPQDANARNSASHGPPLKLAM